MGPDIILDFSGATGSIFPPSPRRRGDQALDFIADKGFSATDRELRYGTDGRLKAGLDGDGHADFIIVVAGAPALDRSDFIL